MFLLLFNEMSIDKKIKIFIIEDNKLFKENLYHIAKNNNFIIVGESTQELEILELIKQTCPDVVILDIVIPEQNTFKLIKKIKEINEKLPVIACSSLTEEHIVTKILEAGCFDYVFKPVSEKKIIESIQNATGF